MMLRDGTEYLALVRFRNGEQDWCIVKWGEPAGLSDPSGKLGWITKQFKLREPKFVEYFELNAAIEKLKKG